jgi:hypothetical protein
MAGYTRKTTGTSKASKPPSRIPPKASPKSGKKPSKGKGGWKPSGSVNPADEGL